MSAAWSYTMLFQSDVTRKMPLGWQAVFCFALVVMGVMIMASWAKTLSEAGTIGLWIAYLLIGALFLIAGLPGLIEAIMTMNAEAEKAKIDAKNKAEKTGAVTTSPQPQRDFQKPGGDT